MKIPIKYKNTELDEIINQVLLGPVEYSSYGSEKNFYFLVLWEGGDYAAATWEDQSIILKEE